VFDAAGAPPGLPQSFSYEGINVQFARDPGNADELLEILIEAHDAPRKLVVVSGDHRVQRAARRRRATAIDSDVWWAELRTKQHRRKTELPASSQKPTGDLATSEVDYWLAQFTDAPPEGMEQHRPSTPADDFENPFPPGYGDDLLDEAD
jgi:predicted RNA-binding protein with PIN domain